MSTSNEMQLADEIVSVLLPGALRLCSEESEAICYTVRGRSLRLRSIVLSRESLRHLLRDPARAVKIEYLRRDLLRSAIRYDEYRYPRSRVRPRLFGAA
ncbi:MAG TPA: hypothetical protein VGS96_07375 [Thermoanaerobaculia bacterium]|jgi:hypothetical protein|nr:hypothetical protein [Thermoanaerobaculia bacterium]